LHALARRTRTRKPALSETPLRRLLSPFLKLLSAAGAAVVVTALMPAVASQAAQPKTVAQAQAQLDALDNQAEVASEEFNGAQIRLTQAQQAAGAANAAAARAHGLVLTEQTAVGALAAESYKSGGLSQGLAVVLSTKDPAQMIARMATLQHLSSQQSSALAAMQSADLRYQQSVASAAQATAAAAALSAQLTQKQAQLKAALAQGEKVLAQLTTQQRAQLVAAQKAKIAAEQARAAVVLANYKRSQAASRSALRPAIKAAVVTLAAPPQSAGGSSVAQRAVAAAMSRLGLRYVFGAGGAMTFDCSGLVQWAYGQAGIGTAHYTGAFWNSYRHIPANQLQPGDLVFFYRDHHHVGIYIGNGMMVNAPHTGDVVRIASVAGHGGFSGAVRVVG
jgi:peptidoglycan DL-endopeptidase CwlO